METVSSYGTDLHEKILEEGQHDHKYMDIVHMYLYHLYLYLYQHM